MNRTAYGPIQKVLHWLVFLLVVFVYGITYAEEFFPRGDPGRAWVWWLHISFGLLLAAVIVVRIAARTRLGTLSAASSTTPLEERLARLTHLLLYILMVAVVIVGVVLAFYRGNELTFFGLFTIPSPVASDRATAHSIQELHELGATVLILLVSLHSAAALWHHFVRRDDVLARMLPERSA
jgi:cytochrome b561